MNTLLVVLLASIMVVASYTYTFAVASAISSAVRTSCPTHLVECPNATFP